MGALIVAPKTRSYQYVPERCIGCGLCAVACEKTHALTMQAEPNYQPPPGSSLSALWQVLPNYLRNAWSAWRKYSP